MSQPAEKSLSCMHIGVLLELTVQRRGIPCLNALSTLTLFDYVQSQISQSVQRLPDPSAKPQHDEAAGNNESVRSELQELLRRAYAESERERRVDNENGSRR